MIKCPKCESEMKNIKNNLFICDNCGNCYIGNHIELLEQQHQQRLDNVLKHFELKGGYYTFSPNGIDIYYNANNNNGKFMLYGKFDNERSVIKLDTVECLLRDLGVMK